MKLLTVLIVLCCSLNRVFSMTVNPCENVYSSKRICKAVRSILSMRRMACDPNELHELRQRVRDLEETIERMHMTPRQHNSVDSDCPGGVFKGRCYFLMDNGGAPSMLPHDDAESACQSQGGTLVPIDNEDLYNFLFSYVQSNASDIVNSHQDLVLVWTGAFYRNGQVIRRDNKPTNFVRWNARHPLNVERRNRVAFAVAESPDLRGMFDASPSSLFYPLCQMN
ncbi:unnamed protein product [Clavelina lepadiformis]|uniref:C-type lectin domain-containing protein n=1 Tax=Clavelina lepadiformis TaxID=159417 RepID=A0ABP0GGG9_CLALP